MVRAHVVHAKRNLTTEGSSAVASLDDANDVHRVTLGLLTEFEASAEDQRVNTKE